MGVTRSSEIVDPMGPVPIPEQVPAKEGMAALPDTNLGYWDTGGTGEPVVFLHPASGSALIWLYQQPVFAKAGYRVIAYSGGIITTQIQLPIKIREAHL